MKIVVIISVTGLKGVVCHSGVGVRSCLFVLTEAASSLSERLDGLADEKDAYAQYAA